jgi:hypothetical protein
MTEAIFKDYIENQFFPIVDAERHDESASDQPAILFCDNLRAHCDDALCRKLAEKWVILITYPPHTSNIFQVLDRLTFSVLKNQKRQVQRDGDLHPVIDHVRRVLVAYERSTGSETIRAAWRRTGFDYVLSDGGTWRLHLNTQKFEEYPEYVEVWRRDFPIENLPPRRAKQSWGWVNRRFFPPRFVWHVTGEEEESSEE